MNSTFFILSKLDEYLNINQTSNQLNSQIINLNIKQKSTENIQITFRHLVRGINISRSKTIFLSIRMFWIIPIKFQLGCFDEFSKGL